MKTFILLLLLLTCTAQAEKICSGEESAEEIKEQLLISTDVPAYLKGATVIVRLANGKESSVPAEKFKVVPRKQQFIATRTEKTKTVNCNTTTNEPRKNRIAILGGPGTQSGLNTSTNGSTVEIETKAGLVGGAQYQRMLDDRFSVGIQGQTNKTGSLILGLDF